VIAAPDGKVDARDRRFWNATESCCDFDLRGVDDAAYLAWVIADVRAHYAIDPSGSSCSGTSNGGFMAHRLACDQAQVVAAIVSIAGGAPRTCAPKEPVAVLEIHGDADEVVPYDGGPVLGFTHVTPVAPARETMDAWATRNGCSTRRGCAGRGCQRQRPTGMADVARPRSCGRCTAASTFPRSSRPASRARFDFLFAHPKP
jgi:polyhydroxybutyrate depolymerase